MSQMALATIPTLPTAVVLAEIAAGFGTTFAALRWGGLTVIQACFIGWLAGVIVGVAVYGWP